MEVNVNWKEKDEKYLSALEIFLDKASNIQEENLRNEIITASLKCDQILTELAIKEINRHK